MGELTQLLGPRVADVAGLRRRLAARDRRWLVGRWLIGPPLFRSFNRASTGTANVYMGMVGGLLRLSVVALVVYGGLLVLTYGSFQATPKGFIPSQDKGYLLVNVQLPDSASVQRTQRVMRSIEEIAHEDAGRQAHGGHCRPIDPAGRQRARISARCT